METKFLGENGVSHLIELIKSLLNNKVDKVDGRQLSRDNVYPIGSIYLSVSSTDPSELFGGTWETFGAGRVLVGVDTSQTEFNTVEKTGGAKTHTLTTEQMPSHTHIHLQDLLLRRIQKVLILIRLVRIKMLHTIQVEHVGPYIVNPAARIM